LSPLETPSTLLQPKFFNRIRSFWASGSQQDIASTPSTGQEALQDPSLARWRMLRGQLEGAEKVPLLPGRYGEGSQKSRELGRFPSGDLESRKAR
jgi:hypothetical protein